VRLNIASRDRTYHLLSVAETFSALQRFAKEPFRPGIRKSYSHHRSRGWLESHLEMPMASSYKRTVQQNPLPSESVVASAVSSTGQSLCAPHRRSRVSGCLCSKYKSARLVWVFLNLRCQLVKSSCVRSSHQALSGCPDNKRCGRDTGRRCSWTGSEIMRSLRGVHLVRDLLHSQLVYPVEDATAPSHTAAEFGSCFNCLAAVRRLANSSRARENRDSVSDC